MKKPICLLSLALLPLASALAQTAPAVDSARIDALFAAYTDKTPGCALGVSQQGKLVYAKGYGLADLSHRVPIQPETVFDIGSVSKQFTAVALLLLEEDAKLKLDDTLQQHLPELAKALPQRITIRQLLHHTAGLRDYNELLILGGEAEENVTGDAEALHVIRTLPALNFAPGSSWSYSNTGYFLAAQIVQKLSGGSLDALLQARVFKPLGMTASHVRTDHTQVVAQRATAYRPGEDGAGGGWAINMSNWNQAGDGAVQSTVLDMARWDAELGQPKVLSKALVQALRTPGRLSDGRAIAYALGQVSNDYRGLQRISHGGSWGGYRAMAAHFPTQLTGLTVLCNAANANPPRLLNEVADLVIGSAFPEPPLRPPSAEVALPAGFDAQRFSGNFLHAEGHGVLRLSPETKPGQLRMHIGFGSSPLHAVAADVLQNSLGTLRLSLSADGRELAMSRRADPGRVERYQRLPDFKRQPQSLAGLAGSYRQAQLRGELKLTAAANGDSLMLSAGADPEQRQVQLVAADLLAGPGVVLRIERNAKGEVKALVYSSERVRDLRYER